MKRTAAFALLPLLVLLLGACAQRSTGGGGDSGIRGVVMAGPQCPVESAQSPCPDRPLPDTEVQALQQGTIVARVTTDREGRFSMPLQPGDYQVRAAPGQRGFMSARPVEVTVTSGSYADVTITVDTGIR